MQDEKPRHRHDSYRLARVDSGQPTAARRLETTSTGQRPRLSTLRAQRRAGLRHLFDGRLFLRPVADHYRSLQQDLRGSEVKGQAKYQWRHTRSDTETTDARRRSTGSDGDEGRSDRCDSKETLAVEI